MNISKLRPFRHSLDGRPPDPPDLSAAGSGTAKAWPGRSALTAFLILFTALFGLAGCGHATVPCPTPTTQLDRLRGEAERLREETERAQTEEGAWEARREAAASRAEAAQARLDSIAAGRDH